MKSIATILFVFISVLVMAQTKLDTLVFNKVNDYRVSNNIPMLKWDTTCFNASRIHTDYLAKTGKVGHTEDSLKETKDRLRVFDKRGKWTIINEIAVSVNLNIKGEVDFEKLATAVVEKWKSSRDHNVALLDYLFIYFGGVSCKIIIKPSGLKEVNNYQVFATMIIEGGSYRKL